MNIDNVCMKCGGCALRDFDPNCEHERVPQPMSVELDGANGERVWCAIGTAHNSTRIISTSHPLRDEAIRTWRVRWHVGAMLAKLAEMLGQPAIEQHLPTRVREALAESDRILAKAKRDVARGEIVTNADVERVPVGEKLYPRYFTSKA